MVDILAVPEMIEYKREKPKYPIDQIYDIRNPRMPFDMQNHIIKEGYQIPYRPSKAGCL